ncbi:cyclic peptide export ABC transporter [Paraburkholderia phenoliruptrix]|uniref:cyclic peptide export ABC transporter n=2 Tax=Pseudomonadota TaxID=1224 RepID=UPI001C4F2CFE|nr:cyclic peptide export ABC transporter [Paraburkholderia phenoliruptrix]MBW0446975.1 cyclic peptide export ABC transporter [Paraburkholderia phenoliruptrix]MBW9099471.1 cyclic peptide export ABC transporter [Paraburkholderia phenoliruptrix]
MKTIMQVLGFRWRAITVTMMLALVTTVLNAVLLYMVGSAESMRHLAPVWVAVQFGAIVCVYTVAQRALAAFLARQSEDAQSRMRLDLLAHLQGLEHASFERSNEAELRTLVTHDALVVTQFWPTFVSLLVSSFTVLLCVGYLAWVDLWQLLAVVLGLAVTFALYAAETANLPLLLRHARDAYAELGAAVSEMLGGAKELKLDRSRRVADFWPMLRALSHAYRDKSAAARRKGMMAGATGSATFFLLIGAAAFLPQVVAGAAAHASTQLIIVMLYLSGPINRIVLNLPAYGAATTSARRIRHARVSLMASREMPIATPSSASPLQRDWQTLRFEAVEYDFPASGERADTTFGPVSFSLKRGEITFIVGPNGAGKSTVGKLLTGLYRPARGRIALDGRDIATYARDEYRQLFCAVFSDFHLFDGLLRADHSHERFARLVEGFRLPRDVLTDRSRAVIDHLSDGQRRRLALLMAFLEDKPIYFFDEWASDQDPEFRAYFYHDVMQQLRASGKTVVAITHDDAYFDAADSIVRIDARKTVDAACADLVLPA